MQHGIDALPGMTILSACLETVSEYFVNKKLVYFLTQKLQVSGVGGGSGYLRVDDPNDAFASQASWTREPTAVASGSSRTSERKYGT